MNADQTSSSSSASMDGGTHTPGPWGASGVFVDALSSEQMIAKAHYGENVTFSQAKRNARLIAAAPDLFTEHGEWAAMFGEALALALQGDYSKVDELAKSMRIIFPDCTPTLYSAAIAKATA